MLCPCRVLTRASSLVPTSTVRNDGARRGPRLCCCVSCRIVVVPDVVSPSAWRVRCFCPSEATLRLACALFSYCVCCVVLFCAQLSYLSALVVGFTESSSDHWKVSLSMGRVSSSLGSATCPRAYRVGLFAGWVSAASCTFLRLLLMVLPARFLGKPLLTSCVLLRACEEPLAVPAVGNAGSKPWSSRLLTE